MTPTDATHRLARLRRCPKPVPYRVDDETVVCANDGFELDGFGSFFRHSAAEIKALVEIVAEGWPVGVGRVV